MLLDPDESLGRRIVLAREHGIPVFVTVGAREASAGTVSLREVDGVQSVLTIAEAAAQLRSRVH